MTTAASDIGAKDKLPFGDQVVKMFNSDRCDKRLFCDVTIQAREKRFAVHRAMLGLRSKFFEKLFTSEMKEKFAAVVKIDMDDDRLERILDYAYTGVMDFSGGNATDILEDAEYTELLDLKTECETYMFESVDVDNCLKLRSYALRYNLTQVADKSTRVIEDNFAEIVEQEDFKQLKVDEMSAIIDLEKVKFQGEVVYTGIVRWVNHNTTSRKQLFAALFARLDLSTFSGEVMRIAATEDLVREDLQCTKALLDATICFVPQNYNDLKGCILAIGGEGVPKQCAKYDITTGSREVLAQLNSNRVAASSVKCGNKIITCGGADGVRWSAKASNKCEVLDLSDTIGWAPRPDMPEARKLAAATMFNGMMYVSGGRDVDGKDLSTCSIYSIANNIWKSGPRLLCTKRGHAMVALNDALFCLGGFGGSDMNMRYGHDSWTTIASMKTTRGGLAAVAFGRWIYAIGGNDGSKDLASVERYDPTTDTWSNVRPMSVARSYHGAFAFRGKIYVVAGDGKKSVEVYDPKEETWTTCFDLEAVSNDCNFLVV